MPDKDLQCWTKKKTDGGTYTTCEKKTPAKKKPAKKKPVLRIVDDVKVVPIRGLPISETVVKKKEIKDMFYAQQEGLTNVNNMLPMDLFGKLPPEIRLMILDPKITGVQVGKEESPLTPDETTRIENLEVKYRHLDHYIDHHYGEYRDRELAAQQKKTFEGFELFRKSAPAQKVIKFMKTKLSKKGIPPNSVDIAADAETMEDNINYQFKRSDKKREVRNDEPIMERGELQYYEEVFLRASDKISGIKSTPPKPIKLVSNQPTSFKPTVRTPPETIILNPRTGLPYPKF